MGLMGRDGVKSGQESECRMVGLVIDGAAVDDGG